MPGIAFKALKGCRPSACPLEGLQGSRRDRSPWAHPPLLVSTFTTNISPRCVRALSLLSKTQQRCVSFTPRHRPWAAAFTRHLWAVQKLGGWDHNLKPLWVSSHDVQPHGDICRATLPGLCSAVPAAPLLAPVRPGTTHRGQKEPLVTNWLNYSLVCVWLLACIWYHGLLTPAATSTGPAGSALGSGGEEEIPPT